MVNKKRNDKLIDIVISAYSKGASIRDVQKVANDSGFDVSYSLVRNILKDKKLLRNIGRTLGETKIKDDDHYEDSVENVKSKPVNFLESRVDSLESQMADLTKSVEEICKILDDIMSKDSNSNKSDKEDYDSLGEDVYDLKSSDIDEKYYDYEEDEVSDDYEDDIFDDH